MPGLGHRYRNSSSGGSYDEDSAPFNDGEITSESDADDPGSENIDRDDRSGSMYSSEDGSNYLRNPSSHEIPLASGSGTQEAIIAAGSNLTRMPQTEATVEGEFNVPRMSWPSSSTQEEGVLSLSDLLEGGKSKAKLKLKRFLGGASNGVNVPTPLPKSTRQRVERQAAYAQSKELADEWRFVVKRNREKESLDFTTVSKSTTHGQGVMNNLGKRRFR